MDAKEKVLATMKEAGQPLNAGKIAELSGLDRKEVDAAMKQLKALSGPPIIEENGIACIALMATFAGVLLTSAIIIISFLFCYAYSFSKLWQSRPCVIPTRLYEYARGHCPSA